MQEESKKIKTALEIAMEKVGNIVVDPAEVRRAELKKQAMTVMGEFLKDSQFDLKKKLQSLDFGIQDEKLFLAELSQVLLSNVQLPSSDEAKEWSERNLKTLTSLTTASISGQVAQALQLMDQYLKQKVHIEEQLKEQFQAALTQMEAQVGARLGGRVKLAPEASPEYVKRRNEIFARLDAQFNQALEQLKEYIASCLPH